MATSDLRQSFQNLLDEHRKILYKVCNSYCRDPDSREDLAQEIIVQLWRSFPRFDGRCRFSTWMYRIALNVAISFYRSESARTRHVISGEQRLLDTAAEPDDDVRLLHEFIDVLDPLNKALILLYLDGHTYSEIADVLGISGTNASTKINRLKSRIRKDFNHGTRRPQGKVV